MPTRKRRQSGGDGNSYSFGAAVTPGAPYASEVVRASSCMAVDRPGMIAGYSPPGMGGLPGMAGGGRRSKRSGHKRSGHKRSGKKHGGKRSDKKRSRKSMKRLRGGRYVVAGAPFPESSSVGPNVFAPVTKLGCNFQGGGGGLGADNLAYSAPTAGYGNSPSSWVGATGSPVLLQAPYEARTMNQACIKTGGGMRRGSKRSGSKRSGSKKHGGKRSTKRSTKRSRKH